MLQIVKKTVEVPEVPLLQCTNKVVDIPVVAPRQISQLQDADNVVDVPAVFVVLVTQVQVVEKTVETPNLLSDVQGPHVQVVERTVQIPQLPFVEKIGVTPETVEISQLQLVEKRVKSLCVLMNRTFSPSSMPTSSESHVRLV